ncbi:hypothetical protein [Streptomyces sp. NPDC093260]|uniref:hypothetical protein n=1 Tax=Streptomyces sp. NPDC093260 TaxID=3155073 RepID=UPI00344A9FE9
MGTADGAAEEHGGRPIAQVGQEVYKLLFVVPAVEAHVGPQLVEGGGRTVALRAPTGSAWTTWKARKPFIALPVMRGDPPMAEVICDAEVADLVIAQMLAAGAAVVDRS